uniref:Uncharacterized protein n=1 Tax=Solanum tuberosum TaxID=4113 RepID=M1BCP2_SOLTU
MEEMIPRIMSVTGNVEFARCLLDGNSYPTGKILLCTVAMRKLVCLSLESAR